MRRVDFPKLNFSFSPGFSLGLAALSKDETVFNGFPHSNKPFSQTEIPPTAETVSKLELLP
jgi:hypothetical protein